jgi:hypothetical protein
MYVYAYDTFIDSWFGWQTYDAFVDTHTDHPALIEELDGLRRRSGVLAEKHLGWQGDYREQYVTSLPAHNQGCETRLVFARKQGSKGLAFIASPYPMEWLAHLQCVAEPDAMVFNAPEAADA